MPSKLFKNADNHADAAYSKDTLLDSSGHELPRLYSYSQVAKVFGKTSRTIRWWVKTGRIHAIAVSRARLV